MYDSGDHINRSSGRNDSLHDRLEDSMLCVRIEPLLRALINTPLLGEVCSRLGEMRTHIQRMSKSESLRHLMQLIGVLSGDEILSLVPELSLLLVQSRCGRLRWRAWRLAGATQPSSPMGCRKACVKLQAQRPDCVAHARRHEQAVWFYVCDRQKLERLWRRSVHTTVRRAQIGALIVAWYPGEPVLYTHGSQTQLWLLPWLAAAFGFSRVDKVDLEDRCLRSVRQRYMSSVHHTLCHQ